MPRQETWKLAPDSAYVHICTNETIAGLEYQWEPALRDVPIVADIAQPFQVHELLSNARYTWHTHRNYVQLNPNVVPAHIFRIRRKVRSERDFEYFL